jgi:signal transduction histidine kinase
MGAHHRLVALPPHIRTDNRLAVCIAVLFSNVCTKMGPEGRWLSPEVLPSLGVALCVLILGELIGYSIDQVRRSLFRDTILGAAAAAVIEAKTKARLEAVEASAQELERANASNIAQMAADKRLNHVIKGRCGSAISAINLYIQLARPHQAHDMPAEVAELLSQSVGHLQEAIEWCHRRQVFVQLEQKTYVSRPTPVHLETLLRSCLSPADSLSCDVRGELCVDVTALRISVDEIMSNALKYRRKNSTIVVEACLVPPVLRVRIINVNSPGAILLSPSECQQVMLPGYKARTCHAMSDGLGLDSVTTALAAASGSVALSQDRQHTTVEFKLPAYIGTGEAGGEDLPSRIALPSQIACEPPLPMLPLKAPTESVGASLESDAVAAVAVLGLPLPHGPSPRLPLNTAASAPDGGPGAAGEGEGLRLMGIASSHEARAFLSELLANLSAVQPTVLPATPAGCDELCAAVVGYACEVSDAGVEQFSAQARVDAIFISTPVGDVELSTGGACCSAQLVARLRGQGFEGVLCLVPPSELARAHWVDALPPNVDGVVTWQGTPASALQRAMAEAQAILHRRRRGPRDGPMRDLSKQTLCDSPRSACGTAIAPVGKSSVAGTSEVLGDLAAPPVASLRCLGLDDEKIPRQIQRLFMLHHLKADMAVSGVLGATEDEVNHFIEVALGERDLQLEPTTGARTPADLVILDENISPPTILGSTLAVELRARNFAGVIVVLTGASCTHVALIAALEAVDLAFDKGTALPLMAAHVKEVIRKRAEARAHR